MFNERDYIDRLEAADVERLAHLLARPTVEQEKVLRTYLGDSRYQRLHGLALHQSRLGEARHRQAQGNVVVIPPIMGSELTSVDRSGRRERVWLSPPRLVAGHFTHLRLDADGLSEYNPGLTIEATGIMKRYYGELLLALAERWHVHAFWYDWRKDLKISAAELHAQINRWFPEQEAVHFVTHGSGGLVARTFIHEYGERWQAEGGRGRLVMLGAPNYGSLLIPMVLTGRADIFTWLSMLGIVHNRHELLQTVTSFASLYQMLPSPYRMPELTFLYEAQSYSPDLGIDQRSLDNARAHQQVLQDVVDPQRMVNIVGTGQPTFVDVNTDELRQILLTMVSQDAVSDAGGESAHAPSADILAKVYCMGSAGDGIVPHRLGLMTTADSEPVPAFYINEGHGFLHSNQKVLTAIAKLLASEDLSDKQLDEISAVSGLSRCVPASSQEGSTADRRDVGTVAETIAHRRRADSTQLAMAVRRLRVRSTGVVERPYVTAEERIAEGILTRGFLSNRSELGGLPAIDIPFGPAAITINVELGDISDLEPAMTRNPELADPAIDAIAVGHYAGANPGGALLALDRAISAALPGQTAGARLEDESNLLLTQYTQRGILRGDLAQPFFLNDPRAETEGGSRILAIAGMGLPGRFGVPELTVLARELCWALGRMGKRHLAANLIGSGRGNLSVADAVSAWIRGFKHALTGLPEDSRRCLTHLTFIDLNPQRVTAIHKAILYEQQRLGAKNRFTIVHEDFSNEKQAWLLEVEQQHDQERVLQQQGSQEERSDPSPTRITVELEGGTYRFGAITDRASVPEREIPLDPILVRQANDELVAEWEVDRQLERGQFLERLLLPEDLRPHLYTAAPIVMLMDATTARIHWELVAQPELAMPNVQDGQDRFRGRWDPSDRKLYFLGTSRGFTRQLRTGFAPPPEPPPPAFRILRVLVVADPAEDAHLPGAEEEGIAVADLLERFNLVHNDSKNRIEVVRMFGPREATRSAVLRQLMLRHYDALHFAGHCVYKPGKRRGEPAISGWLFSKGELLSANELKRIDRIPKFVFSNACQSGVTPDRSEKRAVDLAPSFAEQFFARGVSNFVCTAWPVDDAAAREFALTLYAGLLGFSLSHGEALTGIPAPIQGTDIYLQRGEIVPMHVAMQNARCAIADPPNDIRTWGAYQHYGNPFFRFFDPRTMQAESGEPSV